MPKLTIEISELQLQWLQAGAELVNTRVENLAKVVVEREASRQHHIVRCQPKPKHLSADRTPVGRPRLKPEEKQKRELVGFLLGIYQKLKALHGVDYEQLFQNQEDTVKRMDQANDLDGLTKFASEHPWQKIRNIS